MSFFNRRDTTDVADRIMGDVTAQESMLSSTLPQLIAGIVSTVVICTMLAFFDWRLACCVMVTLPLSAGVIALSRRHQSRFSKGRIESAWMRWRACRTTSRASRT